MRAVRLANPKSITISDNQEMSQRAWSRNDVSALNVFVSNVTAGGSGCEVYIGSVEVLAQTYPKWSGSISIDGTSLSASLQPGSYLECTDTTSTASCKVFDHSGRQQQSQVQMDSSEIATVDGLAVSVQAKSAARAEVVVIERSNASIGTFVLKTDEADLNVSWTMDGQPVDLSRWSRSDKSATLSDGTVSTNTTLKLAGLTATVEQRAFATPSGAVDTLLRFRAAKSASDAAEGETFSARIGHVNTLDETFPVPAGATATLHGFLGSSGSATDFAECVAPLPAGATVVREPVGGRSSNGAPQHNTPECTLPFYGLHVNASATDGHGVVFSIGWSGSWRMIATRSADGRSMRVQAGLANFSAPLAPGQGARGVRTLRVMYSGPDVLTGFNVHRRALSRHFLRLDDKNRVRGGIVSSWTAQTVLNFD